MEASESGFEKKIQDRVPDWFAKLVIATMSAIGLGMGSWAMASVSDLRAKQAVNESINSRTADDIKEIKAKLEKIADAVGAKKP